MHETGLGVGKSSRQWSKAVSLWVTLLHQSKMDPLLIHLTQSSVPKTSKVTWTLSSSESIIDKA